MTPGSSLHLRIFGRVQGVGYRANAQREATRLALNGWVRNRADGSVEAVLHGPVDALAAFVDWARRGPRHARVDHLEQSALPPEPDMPTGVVVRPDA